MGSRSLHKIEIRWKQKLQVILVLRKELVRFAVKKTEAMTFQGNNVFFEKSIISTFTSYYNIGIFLKCYAITIRLLIWFDLT